MVQKGRTGRFEYTRIALKGSQANRFFRCPRLFAVLIYAPVAETPSLKADLPEFYRVHVISNLQAPLSCEIAQLVLPRLFVAGNLLTGSVRLTCKVRSRLLRGRDRGEFSDHGQTRFGNGEASLVIELRV